MKKSGLKWCVEEEIKTLAPPITAFFISLFLTCFSSQLFLYQGCRGDWIYWARSRVMHLTGCLKTRTCLTFRSLVYSALYCDKKNKKNKKKTEKQTNKKRNHLILTTQQILHNKSSSVIFLKHLTTKKLTKWKTDYLLLIYIFLFQWNKPLVTFCWDLTNVIHKSKVCLACLLKWKSDKKIKLCSMSPKK